MEEPMTKAESRQNATIEALKLVLRLYVIAVVPTLLTILLMGINTNTGVIDINWVLLRATFLVQTITFVGAGLDKWKHEFTKALDPKGTEGESKGIVPF